VAYLTHTAAEQQLSQTVAEQLVGLSFVYPEPAETSYIFISFIG